MKIPMIRSFRGANAHNPYESALVKVPGAWVPAVFSMIKFLDEHRRTGLLVTNIGPNSPAAKAGMACGDLLLRYGGAELHKSSTFRRLAAANAGATEQVTIEALRGGKQMRFEVPKGPLGITVSALFRRLIPSRH